MKSNSNEGKTSTASVYRLLQNPAPICMFYFAHPFGITSPASGAKLAQIRDNATQGCKQSGPLTENTATTTTTNGTNGEQKQQRKSNGKVADGVRHLSKSHRKINGLCSASVDGCGTQSNHSSHREPQRKHRKHRTHRRISNFEKFLLEIQHSHTCGRGSSKVRRIDREDRLTPLVPWPSTIWNRDFLLPTLLQALAQQHGRKIPDIEQILRTVRSAWNTPKSQRSHLQSQDSRESSASNWDLSSLCDSCCLNTGHQRMGAGTYANSASPGPGLLRRRYSVPEIIMRKHTLAQQKTDDEPLWLHHDTNHNVIEVVVNKQTASARALLNGRLSGPRTPPHRKSFGLRQHREQHHHGSLTGRSSSVESGAGGCTNDWLAGTIPTGPGTLTATGSDPNLAALKHRNLAGGRCSSPLCNGIGLTRAVANGTGGSLRSIHNNSLSCSSSSSVNSGVPLANGGVVGGVGVGGCGHHQQQQSHQQQQQQYYPVVPPYRDGDFSMRKTTLLRRMWNRELRRYERSGSWSPPLRRAPRRIYSVESIVASVEGHHSPSRAPDDAESVLGERVPGRPGSSGSGSSVGSGRCATTATTTTTATTGTSDTTGTTSCLECAKLESQYNGDFGTGKKLLARTRSRDTIDCSGPVSGGQSPPVPVSPSDPATVDDRRQRRRQRMCSSQTADLGESEPIILASAVSAAATVLNGPNVPEGADQHPPQQPDEDEDEYPSHSSSVSSIASQSYRVSSAARARPDNESDLCEFLQQERLAAADGDGVDRAAGREVAAVRAGSAGAGDNSRERAPVANGIAGTAGPAAEAVEPAEPAVSIEQQFPVGSKRRPSEDSSVALSAALSEDSDSSEEAGSDIEAGDNRTTNGVDEAERVRLDEYISGLLLDNLNNIADAKELVLATDARDGETILGVYSERRAQLCDHKPTEADRQNNNQSTNVQLELQHAGSMKQKLTEKYFGDGGGVVCNSPPQPDKRKLSPKPGDGNDGAECDKENEEDVANNNSNSKGKSHISNNNDAGERNHRRQKHRAKGNGFFLRSGSKSPRPIDPAIHGGAAEFDLNGKYYFPAYGLETDPSDNTDIASEPEGLVLGKIGTGSTYDRGSAVVPRFSAMPRTESMEVQPSSTNSAEDDGDRRKGRRDEEDDVDDDDDNDDDDDDSDASSLVDSLDGFGPAQMMETVPRTRKPRHAVKGAVAGESTTSSTDRSPRHEKGEAFFVPIHAEKVAAFKIDERVVVADTMPLRIKERLNNRRRMMKWKQEQENLKKQRKMMRMIEQKRFYGEPAIQVISTIDKAISRKEFIPPGAKKSVFGGASAAIVRDTPSTPPAPTPFRAMKPKKRAGGPAATGSALRTELGMLESYKIDGKGNMQIQTTAAAGPGGRKGAAAPTLPAASKSPWGMSAEKRQGKPPHTQSATASTTVGSSARTASTGRTGTGKVPPATDGRRRQQVLKDVQQMTLYPQADLTPDIEGGPRRVYQKTEIQEGDKHIEILEIVECADSAPRNRHGGANRPARVHSAGRRHERGRSDAGNNRNRSRIPVPIYRFGHYGRSIHSRDGSPLSTGSNPKVDRMIADLLLEALTNPEEVGVKLVRTPEALRDASRSSTKSRPVAASSSKKSSASSTCGTGSGTNGNNNLLTPRRTASGRYTQKFEVIPEERSSVSIESSTEELSTGGGGGSRKKGPHPSPRRVSFDENHQILNRDELEPPTLVVPSPSPKRQPAATSPAKSPTRAQPPAGAGVKKQGTATVMTGAGKINNMTNTTNTTTTTSRGKAAIQSDVIEEKGWIGFSTQHEDMATPIHNGQDDEDTSLSIVPRAALEQTPSRSQPHVGRSVVRTITIGNCVPEAIEHLHHRAPRSPDHTTIVSNASPRVAGRPVRDANDDIHNTCHLSSTADSFATDSLNAKLTPISGPSFPSLPTSAVRCCATLVDREVERSAGTETGDMATYHQQHHHHAHHHPRLPAAPFQHQIREENAWQVFQTGDCKVIQSKIEYYETSIHRTPLTGAELFATESNALCPHTAPLSTADSLEELARSTGTGGSWHRQRTTSFGAGSEGPPKTSDTTCSSCCFCNPELHNHNGSVKSVASDGCFYCRAKLGQSPTRSFPAPPTPPNIQTSPVPPSPQTPIAELTPTPSLHEIAVPVRKSSLAGKPLGKDAKTTDGKAAAREEASKKGEMTAKAKHAKVAGEPVAEKLSKRSTGKSSCTTTTTTTTNSSTATTVSSTVARSEEGPQKPLPPIPGATPKIVRKKMTEPGGGGGILNRPKYTNHLTRASTVVHSVQKEIKNELHAPIRVLPKTAKEVNNRKEKERQIGLSLPKDYDSHANPRAPPIAVAIEDELVVVGGGESAETHGYDNETSSSDTSDGNSSIDSSPNVSPYKRPNLQQQQQQSLQKVQPPTAATRWKTNSERNLSQLAIQKLVSASRWGSKWRKGSTRGPQQLEQSDGRNELGDDDEMMPSMGSCSELSPLKTGTASGGPVGSTAGTTTSNIISGITQTSSNQGWTVTVAGNYNPEMAPDVEMRLSFPKGAATGASGGKSALTSSSGSYGNANGPPLVNGAGRNRQAHQYADGTSVVGDHHLDGGSYLGASRSTSRAGTLPPASSQAPPSSLNPRRNLTRSDGTGAGTSTAKDYRLPNVGPTHNILARPTARKAIKTVECSVVASATRTIANSYHQLSHQHQVAAPHNGPQQQQHASRPPPMTTARGVGGAGRSRLANQPHPTQPSTQVLHPTLQNGSGGKFLSSSSPSLVSQQQHPSQRFHHTEPSYHLEDYGNDYYRQQQQSHPRRMSLDSHQYQHQQQQLHSQQHPAGSLMATDCLSVMGNAIAPEIKPRVPTMSEKDVTRRHHVCYTRTQPYFS